MFPLIHNTINYDINVAFDKSYCKGEQESVSKFVIEELNFDRDQREDITIN